MANYTVDPATGILIPIVGVDPGPDYAQNISNALSKLANLTHTGVSNLDGYQIPSAGLNINADVSAQSNNLTALRSVRFTSQSGTLAGSGDIDCVYVDGGNLFYNNGSGTPIQITAGSTLDVTVTNNYVTTDITTNLTINPASTTTFVSCDSTGGAIVITLPLANAVPNGRFYMIKDAAGSADVHNITINCAGGDLMDSQTGFVLDASLGAVAFVSNGVSQWHILFYDRTKYQDGEELTFEALSTLRVESGANASLEGLTSIQGQLGIDGYVLSTGSYTIPTTGYKTIILCIPSAGALTVNLPQASVLQTGAIIIIKDAWGTAATNNITINPHGTDNIEGLNAPKKITANWGSITLCSAKAFANNYWVML